MANSTGQRRRMRSRRIRGVAEKGARTFMALSLALLMCPIGATAVADDDAAPQAEAPQDADSQNPTQEGGMPDAGQPSGEDTNPDASNEGADDAADAPAGEGDDGDTDAADDPDPAADPEGDDGDGKGSDDPKTTELAKDDQAPTISFSQKDGAVLGDTGSIAITIVDQGGASGAEPVGLNKDATTVMVGDREYSVTDGKCTVLASELDEGEYSVSVVAADVNGNSTTASLSFMVDKTAPKISVEWAELSDAKDAVVNGVHYYTARKAKVTIEDKHFNPSDATITMTAESGAEGTCAWDGNVATIDFAKDAKGCAFEVYVEDMAGNKAVAADGSGIEVTDGEYALDKPFNIFTTPMVDVSFNQDGIVEDGVLYYYEIDADKDLTLKATVTVVDPYFEDSQVEVSAADGDGTSVTGLWSQTGITHKQELSFAKDGASGRISVATEGIPAYAGSAQDTDTSVVYGKIKDPYSGGSANAKGISLADGAYESSFTIDSTPPYLVKVEYSGSPGTNTSDEKDNNLYYKGSDVASAVVSVEERILNKDGSPITVSINGNECKPSVSSSANSKTYTFGNINFTEGENLLSISGTDLGGRTLAVSDGELTSFFSKEEGAYARTIMVDGTAPVLSVSGLEGTQTAKTASGEFVAVSSKAVTVQFDVDEDYFDKALIKVYDNDKEVGDVSVEGNHGSFTIEGADGDTASKTHVIKIEGTDIAGNSLTYKGDLGAWESFDKEKGAYSATIAIDKDNPELTVSYDQDLVQSVNSEYDINNGGGGSEYVAVCGNDVQVQVKVDDAYFDADKVNVTDNGEPVDVSFNGNVGTFSLKGETGKTISHRIVVSGTDVSGHGMVYSNGGSDLNGWESFNRNDGRGEYVATIVIDKEAPTMMVEWIEVEDAQSATIEEDGEEVDYYTARKAKVTIEDKHFNPSDATITMTAESGAEGTCAWDGNVATIDFAKDAKGCAFEVYVEDMAGNKAVAADGSGIEVTDGEYALDKPFNIFTTPMVDVSFNQPGMDDEGTRYYFDTDLESVGKPDLKATVTVVDPYFEDSRVEVSAADGDGASVTGLWSQTGITHKQELSFAKDGESGKISVATEGSPAYVGSAEDADTSSVYGKIEDPYGKDNEAGISLKDGKYEKSFVIDSTPPYLVEVEYADEPRPNSNTEDTKLYYKGSDNASATVMVEEQSLHSDGSPIAVSVGNKVFNQSVTRDRDSKTYTFSGISFEKGENVLTISGTDVVKHVLAVQDNTSEGVRGFFDPNTHAYTRTIVVDGTNPVLSVSYGGQDLHPTKDAEGNAVYASKDDVTVGFDINEDYFDKTLIEVYDNGEPVDGVSISDDGHGSFTLSGEDGKTTTHVIKIEGTDIAGNPLVYPGFESSGWDSFADGAYGATIVIDKEKPELAVSVSEPISIDGKDADLVRYYGPDNNNVSATITITDAMQIPETSELKATCADAEFVEDAWSEEVKDGKYVYTRHVEFPNPAKNNAEGEVKDKDYNLEIEGKDAVGLDIVAAPNADTFVNEYGKYASIVRFDVTAPVLDLKWDNADAKNGKYYNAKRTAAIEITEAYFDPARITIVVDGKSKTTSASDWETIDDGKTHRYVSGVDFDDESQDHSLEITGVDRADNKLVGEDNQQIDGKAAHNKVEEGTYSSGSFVIDMTYPVVTFTTNQGISGQLKGVDYYRSGKKLTITATVSDTNFNDLKEDKYADATKIDFTGMAPDEAGYSKDAWKDSSYTYTFSEHGLGGDWSSVKATVQDLAGNTTVVDFGKHDNGSGNVKFALDITAPAIVGNFSSLTNIPNNYPTNDYMGKYQGKYLFYKNQTTLQFRITDALGIRTVAQDSRVGGSPYSVSASGNEGDKTRLVTVSLRDGDEFTNTFRINTTDNAGNHRTWAINPRTGEVDDVTGSSTVNTPVYGSHTGLYPDAAIQDTVAPVLAFSGVTPGQYYNSTQTVHLAVNELNFRYLVSYDSGQTVVTVNKQAGNAGRAASSQTYSVGMFNAVNAMSGSYSRDFPFAEDGHYTLEAVLTDPAGNVATTQRVGEFTIDKTAPTIQVTWDNNDARNGNYYKAARTATIVVTEHNFDPSQFTITTTGSIGGWSSSGDTHTVIVSFASDGRYTLSVSGQDKAGNSMNTYTEPEFVIDLTAPKIEFDQIEAETSYNNSQVVAPVIIYSDEANLDSSAVEWTLTGSKHGVAEFGPAGASGGNTYTATYADFDHVVELDDIYTLEAHMTDLAGNEAENSIVFSVNRFGSNFMIENADAYENSDGYMAEAPEVIVREVNVSGSESEMHDVSITHGMDTDDLELHASAQPDKPGYYIESGQDSAGWSTYEYHISKANFYEYDADGAVVNDEDGNPKLADGNYLVVVGSDDRAENTNISSSYYDPDDHDADADATVSFILDGTDPLIDGLNVRDGQMLDAETYAVEFSVIENIGVKDVRVNLDGAEVEVSPGANGLYSFDVPKEAWTKRNIDITAQDFAGRTAEAAVSDFHVTTDFVELHWPWLVGGAVALGAAGAGGGVAAHRKRQAAKPQEA